MENSQASSVSTLMLSCIVHIFPTSLSITLPYLHLKMVQPCRNWNHHAHSLLIPIAP